MSASLVGSEMCIRDRSSSLNCRRVARAAMGGRWAPRSGGSCAVGGAGACLLYTSDAADDM
eukprot:8334767-Alexandrium_andersonii.AAC.1